jgi:CheY-like chemotaxis protein
VFNKEWEILLVDDDPDVLAVSKLAMRSFSVYGIPLKIHSCASKAEAIELLKAKSELSPTLAVAFIDVVMETDQAGLELCQFIREELKNRVVQLYVRTGQPGVAPERAVIDRYDITGYFSKAEATEDKLYSLTKSGVRQYYWAVSQQGNLVYTRYISMAVGSRAAMAATAQQLLTAAFQERNSTPNQSYGPVHIAAIFDDEVVASVGLDRETALQLCSDLDRLEGTPLSETGDKYYLDDHRLLIKVAAQPNLSEAYTVFGTTFRLPDFVVDAQYNSLVLCAALWHQST